MNKTKIIEILKKAILDLDERSAKNLLGKWQGADTFFADLDERSAIELTANYMVIDFFEAFGDHETMEAWRDEHCKFPKLYAAFYTRHPGAIAKAA